MSWSYDPEALADWLDSKLDEDEALRDKWWKQSVNYNKLEPFYRTLEDIHHATDLAHLYQRGTYFVTRGFIDVLRLGTGISSDQSAWENLVGGFSNALRVLSVAGPLFRVGGAAANGIGLRAASRLKYIKGAEGPCAYVATNNILSFLTGKTAQFFATLKDIKLIRGLNAGISMDRLLKQPEVVYEFYKLGIKVESLKLPTLEHAIAAAKVGDRPIIVSVEWLKPDGQWGKHAITIAKDALGNLKFLDYVENTPGFRGFNSIAEMAASRPQWGPNFTKNLRLIPGADVVQLSNRMMRLMPVLDGFSLVVPIVIGARWTEGSSPQERIHNMLRSAWQFMSEEKKQSLLPPPLPSLKTLTKLDAITPAATISSGLGFVPRSPVQAAAGAPRIDWLTGVQYRLRFLNYYNGEIHGNNDDATKAAVLQFQKEWFKEKQEWDAIPGPHTQARLKLIVGW